MTTSNGGRGDEVTADVVSDVMAVGDYAITSCPACGCTGHYVPPTVEEHQAALATQFASGSVLAYDLFLVRGVLVEAVKGNRKPWAARGEVLTEAQADFIATHTHPASMAVLEDVHDPDIPCEDIDSDGWCDHGAAHRIEMQTGELAVTPHLFTLADPVAGVGTDAAATQASQL